MDGGCGDGRRAGGNRELRQIADNVVRSVLTLYRRLLVGVDSHIADPIAAGLETGSQTERTERRIQDPSTQSPRGQSAAAIRLGHLGVVRLLPPSSSRPSAQRRGCSGSSTAAGWSSFIVTGPLLSLRRMGRGALLTAEALLEMSGSPGSKPRAT
jgi:hypothetical protein